MKFFYFFFILYLEYQIIGVDLLNNMTKTMENTTLTPAEIKVLGMVSRSQIEDGFSEYDSVSSASEKGILGSLVKKGLVHDAREHEEGNDYMYCLTAEGFEACAKLGISTSHIIMFN